LYEAFRLNSVITDLEIGCNYFSTDESAHAFAAIVVSNSTIVKIDLFNIHHSVIHLIFNALAVNRSLSDVTLDFDMMQAETDSEVKLIESLPRMIRCNSTVVKLNMAGSCTGTPADSIELVDAFVQNSAIQELDLSYCRLGSGCGHSFANMIQSNSTLIKLGLKENQFSRDDIESIANALARNSTMAEVDLSIFDLEVGLRIPSPQTARTIANMIACNSSLTYLNVSGFSQFFSGDALTLIAAALKANTSITSIDLSACLQSENEVDETDFNAAAFALADMITTNQTIVKLNLYNNWFSDEGLISIAHALKSNSSIVEIDVCSENELIGDDVLLAFCDIVPFNKTVKSMSFLVSYHAHQFQDSTNELFKRSMLQYPQLKCPRQFSPEFSDSYLF
jgi:hypothetical protein